MKSLFILIATMVAACLWGTFMAFVDRDYSSFIAMLGGAIIGLIGVVLI
jgi:hypothetical protein